MSSLPKRGFQALGAVLAMALLYFALRGVPLQDELLLSSERGLPAIHVGVEQVGPGSARVLAVSVEEGLAEPLLSLSREIEEGTLAPLPDESPVLDWEWHGTLVPHAEFRPGLPTLLGGLSPLSLLAAVLTLASATLLVATRWALLLSWVGCATRWASAFRILWTSLFFNVVLPGLSGGDVARAWLAVQGHPGRGVHALASVAADRILGLWALTLLALPAVFLGGRPFEVLVVPVAVASLGLTVCWGLYAFAGLGGWLSGSSWFERIPGGSSLLRLHRVGLELAQQPGRVGISLLLSVGNHLVCAGSALWIARGLGAELGFVDLIVVTTVANTLSAVPLAPAGLGVGELAFGSLFELAGGDWSVGVATSLVWRMTLVLLGLIGGLGALLPGGRELHASFRRAAQNDATDLLEDRGSRLDG